MIKKVVVYEASDGTRFDCRKDAEAWESLCLGIVVATRPLGDRPSSPAFRGGFGCVVHAVATVGEVRDALMPFTVAAFPRWFAANRHPETFTQVSTEAMAWLTQQHALLGPAWYRLVCIDATGREWGQPYFAKNPDRAGSRVPVRPGTLAE